MILTVSVILRVNQAHHPGEFDRFMAIHALGSRHKGPES
jgi:hypothetical protein